MDIETAEAVDTLRTDIHRLEKKIENVESALTVKIEKVESALTVKIERVESSLAAKIDGVETSLTAKMDEQKRHTDVRLESMHDDIRMLAGHVASLSEKFDSRH